MGAKDMFFSKEKIESWASEKLYAREELIYNVTEHMLVIMEELGISKNELARKLGKSKSYVTQLLNGSRNMTLGTLSDVCMELNTKPKISFSGHSLESEEYKEFAVYWHNDVTNSRCANPPVNVRVESKKNVFENDINYLKTA